MDNTKTGAFIKALRTEKGLTQRELAERLHITDRAVSKWERGLSAPDIALLEPLAEILEVSVVELIRGERVPEEEHTPVLEEHTREVLVYSGQEMRRRENSARKTVILFAVCLLAVLAFLVGFMGWATGAFFLLDDCPSPDGRFPTKVYSKALSNNGFFTSFTLEDCVTVTEDRRNCTMYPGTTYKGLYWSPDSEKYVIVLEDEQGKTQMHMAWLYTNVGGYLNSHIHSGMAASKLRDEYGLPWVDQVELEFIQWGPDGDTMLVWYSFIGENDGLEHFGYFWYDCELVCLSGLFELDVERESDFPFSPSAPFW